MLLIADLLDAGTVLRLRGLLRLTAWQDGRETAGAGAAPVKANEQADPEDPRIAAASAEIQAALRAHPLVGAAALPRRISRPLFSRTRPDGGYGPHVDNAIMAGAGEAGLRSDLAYTLFLTGGNEVSGGALVIEDAGGERAIEPSEGLLVLYPATFLHRVAPVLDGERLAAVGWIQSRVRDAAQRALLFDLHLAGQGGPEAALRLQLARSNLLRMWAEG
jgi:PKHD-type hydroxylase